MNKGDMTSSNIGTIVFSELRTSGNFKKIGISDQNGKKVLIETGECFSWGIQKSDRYDSYSMTLVFKNDDQALKAIREILQRCKDHLPGKGFEKCLYEKHERATTTIYPKLRYYGGRFSTSVYEGDTEVSPLKYLNVRCSARAVICVEGILLGDTTTLLIKVYEAEVSERKEPERPPKRRLLSKTSKRKLKEKKITYPKGYAICEMYVIGIIMDMFETKQTDMLSFRTDLDPLRGLLPAIFREGLDWRRWCNGLSEDEVSRVRMNRDSFEYYAHVTSERLVARGNSYDNLWKIYMLLVMLLARLDGFIPANYEVDLPEGWQKQIEFGSKITREEPAMTSETASFGEILDKSLTQEERNLLRDLLTEKDERTPLQKLFDRYDMYVREERDYKEKLKVALKEFVGCKDEDEMELLIEGKIECLEEGIVFLQNQQKEITEKILSYARYGH